MTTDLEAIQEVGEAVAQELGALETEQRKAAAKHKAEGKRGGGGSGDAVYGIGMIGAWVYYIGRADTWGERGMGFLKGLVWPAFMVYAVLKFLEKK